MNEFQYQIKKLYTQSTISVRGGDETYSITSLIKLQIGSTFSFDPTPELNIKVYQVNEHRKQ